MQRDLSKIECIVLEGGGTNGIAFIGALKMLQTVGVLKNVKYVVGSSSGALQGLFIVLGCNFNDVIGDYVSTDFNDLRDKSFFYLSEIFNFLRRYGFDDGVKFENWIDSLIKKYLKINYTINFKKLYELTNIEYTTTATNINTRETEFFSYKTQPEMSVAHAIRISMSLPLYFTPIKIGNDYFVDGGYLNNYPIWFYDNQFKSELDATMKTLGLKLLNRDESPISGSITTKRSDIASFKDYLLGLLNTNMTQIEKGYIKQGYWDRTIPISIDEEASIVIDEHTKQKLIKIGSDTVLKYL